jgi:hypothetical protein
MHSCVRNKPTALPRTLVVPQHAQERGLACIVETQEKDMRLLVGQAQRVQHTVEPVYLCELRFKFMGA